MEDYNEALDEMENVNLATAVGFRGVNPKVFCRAFMKTDTMYDVIVNIIIETFNSYIINARTKHLIYMLEDIITVLMQRLVLKRQEMEKTNVVLCPRIQVKLEKEKEEAANYFLIPSSDMIFQLNHKMDFLTVDLAAITCTCKK